MNYTLIEHDGLKMVVYGPFSSARAEVEKYTAIVKQTHETHRCWWNDEFIYFYIKEKN